MSDSDNAIIRHIEGDILENQHFCCTWVTFVKLAWLDRASRLAERNKVLEDALGEIAKEVDSKYYQINLGQWDFKGVEYKAVVMSEEAWRAIKNALKKLEKL